MRYRLFALLLSLTVLCSGIGASAEAADKDIEDSFEPIVSQEFDALKAMGFLTEDFLNMSANAAVSRAQFVGALYRLAGFSEQQKQGTIPFADVNVNTPYKDAITYFYNAGIISGSESDTFQPDSAITFAEAIKIAINLLGYEEYTERVYGGYPVGHISMAKKLGLTSGIANRTYNDVIMGNEAVTLLYNCGITCLSEGVLYSSSGEVSYRTDENRYLLSVYSNIYRGEGIMQSNGIVSTTGDCFDDSVTISGKMYKTAGLDFSEFIGQKLNFFYRSVDGINTLLWAAAHDDNNIITINSKDLMTDDSAYSLTCIVYWNNEKKMTLSINRLADIIYNNTICNGSGVEQIKPQTGSIKLVDNNGDRVYDVVIVSEFKNLFAAAVSVNKNFILGGYGNTLMLDDYTNVKIFKDGKVIPFDEVPNNCIISYIESLDKEHLYIYVNGEGVAEILKATSSKGGKTYYTFESGEYQMASSLQKVIADGIYTVPAVRTGNTYKYFLDMAGDIAALEEVDSGKPQYAYLLDGIANDETFGSDGSAKLKLVLKDGSVAVVITADKIKIDGIGNKTGMDLLARASSGGTVTKQVVRIVFNGDGNLSEIEFASNVGDSSEYGYDENKFTLDYNSNAYYMSGNCCMFNSKYCVNGNTVCFATFQDASGNIEYGTIPFSSIKSNETYAIKVYDCDRYFEAGAISIGIKLYDTVIDGHVLVDEVKTILHTDGEIYKQIVGYNFGNKVAYRAVDDGTVPDDLRRGDIIRVALFKNLITQVTVVCRLSENPDAFISGGAGDEFCQVFGPLYSNNGRMIVTVNPEGSSYGKLLPTSAWGTSAMLVSVYDFKNDRVSTGGVNSLQPTNSPKSDGSSGAADGSIKVFIYRRYNYVKELIVAYY